MKTLYVNIGGIPVHGTNDIIVIGGVKDALINKCYYELGKVILRGFPELSSINKQKLVTEFRIYSPEAFVSINRQLEVVKNKVLSDNPLGSAEIILPQEYVDWLKTNANVAYLNIANRIEQQENHVTISLDCIYDRLLASVVSTGSHGCTQFVMNDNAVTDDSALTKAIQSSLNGIAFCPYEDWEYDSIMMQEESLSNVDVNVRKVHNSINDVLTTVKEISSKVARNADKAFWCAEGHEGQAISKELVDSEQRNDDQIKELSTCCSKEYVDSDYIITEQANGNLLCTVNGISFVMLKISGGEFQMGGTEEQGTDSSFTEKPVHTVTVKDFYICETVVTQALWNVVMESRPSQFKGVNRPLTNVTYTECLEFVERLNTLTGKIFRLPSEEEWEYAAKGGSTKTVFKYSGGNNIDDVAWYSANASKVTHDVKKKNPNVLGIYDMSGNVWEWCSSHFHNYGDNREGTQMITRGGCATSTSKACRTSRRYYCDTNHSSCYLGFRLAI